MIPRLELRGAVGLLRSPTAPHDGCVGLVVGGVFPDYIKNQGKAKGLSITTQID